MRFVSLSLLGALAAGCSDYELHADNSRFAQPNPPDLATPVKTDRIVQVTVPAVDVLWVIDNSCSMEDEQSALASNFQAFTDYFVNSDLDYHIGVISTDYDDVQYSRGLLQMGQGHAYIDSTTPNAFAVFGSMARLGVTGSADEKGRAQVKATIDNRDAPRNAGFYREKAHLAVIVISDEDDYTEEPKVTQFIPWFRSLKPRDEMVSFSSIVGLANSNCGADYGRDYLAITRQVGGVEWDICDQNWDTALERLGMQVAGLKREFFLSEVPVVETLHVWTVDLEGERADFERGADYRYSRSRNSIEFVSYVADPLTEVFIEYELLAAQVNE